MYSVRDWLPRVHSEMRIGRWQGAYRVKIRARCKMVVGAILQQELQAVHSSPLGGDVENCGGKGIESDRSYLLKCWGQVLCGQSMES